MRSMNDERECTVPLQETLSPSDFIASLYASWQCRTKLYMVLEYVIGHGDLYQLWSDFGPVFEEPLVRLFAAEIAIALGTYK